MDIISSFTGQNNQIVIPGQPAGRGKGKILGLKTIIRGSAGRRRDRPLDSDFLYGCQFEFALL